VPLVAFYGAFALIDELKPLGLPVTQNSFSLINGTPDR